MLFTIINNFVYFEIMYKPPQNCRQLSATRRVNRPALSFPIDANFVASLPWM